ncbi:MAG TPA: UDP-3-O-acyl-N-acetylglucosamine deacetylase [Gaiellaceae bacterium]|nr:UDP-3-O-acyl-N-acetylglucosamine deacetylase [Gaiellaceae bacterium]
MSAAAQRQTVARRVTLEGVGLHLGRACRLTFAPARGGEGIVFARVDLPGAERTPALVDRATLSERRTQLGEGERALHTVEHVLAAVAAAGVDDVTIEMDAPEPPIMDGSAGPFFEAILAAGLAPSGGDAEYLDLAEPVRVIDGESVYEAFPADALSVEVTIDFPHPLIGRQCGRYDVTRETFARELAGARTFGFVREVDALRSKGLIQGASTENAVVLDERGVVANALRWPDEFVRHKAMDCVGDLALAGRRVRARVVAFKPSHRGTVTLVREMTRQAARGANGAGGASTLPATADQRTSKEKRVLGIEEIMRVLPHRYPFLLVDRIVEIDGNARIVGLKNVTINEPFFQGHFPGHPIMPGVLIIEAMAQVGGMLLMGGLEDPESKVVYFMSLDNVKFRRPVKPGDQIIFEIDLTQARGRVCKMHGVAKVDGEVVCEADMAAMVRDR